MANIQIDQEMLIQELYHLRSFIPVEEEEAKNYLDKIVQMITYAPLLTTKAQYPRISVRHG